MFSPDKWFTNPSTGFYPHTIDQSLRLNNSDNPNLKFDITTDGNRKTYTLSFWFKIGRFDGSNHRQIYTDGNNSSYSYISLSTSDQLYFQLNDGAASRVLYTDRLLRDVSAWYHAVIAVDTTQVTDTDRVKMYINGEQATFAGSAYPTKDNDTTINKNGNDHLIGKYAGNNSRNFGGYLAEMHFVSGSQLAPTSFGETINGIWVPKAYSGSYGTNGFYLTFEGIGTATTTQGTTAQANIGDDQSGTGNNFAVSGLAASDVVPDSPTNNFCTLNPLAYTNGITLSDGNLTMVTTTNNRAVHGTIALPSSGKWYVELHVDSYASGGGTQFGWCTDASLGYDEYSQSKGVFFSTYNQAVTIDGSAGGGNYNSQGNNSTSNGDIYQLLLDVDNKVFYIGKNGTYRNSADPANGTGGLDVTSMFTNAVTDIVFSATRGGSYNETYSINFGQDSKDVASANADDNSIGTFEYAVPSGFLALCTSNLPEPTIGPGQSSQADDHFDTLLYTGNSGTLEVNGLNFQPDFLWIKRRDSAQNFSNGLLNSVTGIRKGLISNRTDAEFTSSGTNDLQSFDNDGFTVGQSNQFSGNDNGGTFVAWSWKAGGSASSNSDGSITSSVSANTDAGFAVGTFTGNATAGATIGHSLGAIPEVVIVKRRSNARDWAVYHKDQSATPTNAYLLLNSTAGVATGNTAWNNGTFTTDVFTIGSHELVNASGDSYVFYAFKGIEGYSKFGSYVGNNSSDGTFVYLGFRPAWIMLKKIDSTAYNWNIHDTARDTANPDETSLFADSNVAENGVGSAGDWRVDMLSNGFKLRENTNYINQTGKTVVYLAFAEAPFKFANAR